VGLKLWDVRELAGVLYQAKSNQGGIETNSAGTMPAGRMLAKSNQGGIETLVVRGDDVRFPAGKIEPRWD
jgi:hypothetical protein